MQIIYDEDQVRQFHALLKPLVKDEVYFLSMSARNKYLTQEERELYNLGRSEMMSRKIVKTNLVEDYIRTIKSYEHSWYGKSYKELPGKCLMCYANINTSSAKLALQEFYKKANELIFNLDQNTESYERLRYLDTELMNCCQRAKGNRKWIDIDFDSPDKEYSYAQVQKLVEELSPQGVETHVISTHSGYHVLMNRSTITFNYYPIVGKLNIEAQEKYPEHAEVVRNPNDMVPVPGTLQGNFEVKLIS